MSNCSSPSRREFIVGTSAAAFSILPGAVFAEDGGSGSGDRLNIAGIGVGGRGFNDLRAMEPENIVALCDVDHSYASKAFKRYPKARVYTDYREMLDKQSDIDAVMIGTPDHTHAVIAMAAIEAGKHVYCEKPLAHNIYECRRLAEAAERSSVCTQMGIQGHSGEGSRLICEWLDDGAVGEVAEVDAWCTLSYYPPGHASWSSKWLTKPEDTPPVPENLDWDLWIGPAPMRDYHPAYHPRVWRCWWDFGSGMMGDRGVHTLDPVVRALNLGYPDTVEATSTALNEETHPLAAVVTFSFPARGGRPPVKLTWYEGLRAPRPPELEDGRIMGHRQGGSLFKGSKGKLVAGIYGNSPRLIPETAMKAYERPSPTIPRIKGSHQQAWIRAVKEGRKHHGAHFGYAALVTEICQLGNIAKRMDARIRWDAQNMRVTNLDEANALVRGQYRDGWEI